MGRREILLALLLSLSGGCGRIGFDPVGGSPGSDGSPGDGVPLGGDSSATCVIAMCPDKTVSVADLSTVGTGTNVVSDRGLSGSCGGAGGGEATFKVNVGSVGNFQFKVQTPGPFVAYVRDGCCGGPELACSTTPMTPFALALADQQIVYLIVDGAQIGTNISIQVQGI